MNAGVSGSTGQFLSIAVGDMSTGKWLAIGLGKAKVDDIDLTTPHSGPYKNILGLDISVDEGLGMDVFEVGCDLVCQQEDGLKRELAITTVKGPL